MKLLLKTPQLIEAQSLKDFLVCNGIESFMINENISFYAQGTISQNMPELWVADEAFEKALTFKNDWKSDSN